MRAEEEAYTWEEMQMFLQRLQIALSQSNCEEVRQLLTEVVKGYQPAGEIADVLWKGKSNQNNSGSEESNSVVELNKYHSKQDN